jgi:hypothetical protein
VAGPSEFLVNIHNPPLLFLEPQIANIGPVATGSSATGLYCYFRNVDFGPPIGPTRIEYFE